MIQSEITAERQQRDKREKDPARTTHHHPPYQRETGKREMLQKGHGGHIPEIGVIFFYFLLYQSTVYLGVSVVVQW